MGPARDGSEGDFLPFFNSCPDNRMPGGELLDPCRAF